MTKEQVIALIAAVTFGTAAFRFFKKHPRLSFALFCFAFFSLILGCFRITGKEITAEQVFCWCLGSLLLAISVYLFADKDKFSFGMVVFLVSAGAFFCGLSSVQTLLKTGMLIKVIDSLDGYTKQLGAYQTNVYEMREDLSVRQDAIKTNQLNMQFLLADITKKQALMAEQQAVISNQIVLLSAMTNTLYDLAQTNAEQEKKLSNLEYWAQNLYDNLREETFTATRTNSTFFVIKTNIIFVVGLLQSASLRNSLELTAVDNNSKYPRRISIYATVDNLFITGGLVGFDTNSIEVTVRYISDARDTNFITISPEVENAFSISPDNKKLGISMDFLIKHPAIYFK